MTSEIHVLPPTDGSPGGIAGDEAALIARAKLDRQAFEPLYRRYLDPVYRYCYRCLGSREASEDATSQIFYRALAALQSYDDGSFRGWLFTIAHNVVVDVFRHQKQDRPIAEGFDVVDEAPTPEELAVAAEQRRSMRALLARLPADQRNAMELRLAGLSGAEIASAMGRSTASVKMLQFRAIARLRGLLGVSGNAEGEREEARDGQE